MKKISIAIVSTLMLLSLVGCGSDGMTSKNKHNAHKMNTNTVNPSHINSSSLKARSKSLQVENNETMHMDFKNHMSKVKEVNDHALLVNNKDIIVGLNIDDKANKAAVEQKVKKMIEKEYTGYKVHVTSDHSLSERIRTMGKQMHPSDGQPIKNMATDIKTLITDIGRSLEKAVK